VIARITTFFLFILAFMAISMFVYANAATLYPGQYNNVDPKIQQWYNNLRNKQGLLCCSIADCHDAEMSYKDGKYYALLEDGTRLEIPTEVIVDDMYEASNPTGHAVVCYSTWNDANFKPIYIIRCFVRGNWS
jgi:hypothetical protein